MSKTSRNGFLFLCPYSYTNVFVWGKSVRHFNYALKKEMVCWTEVIYWHDVCTNSVVTLKDFFYFIYSSVGICASYSYLGFHCEIQPYWFLWGYIPYKGHSVYLERAFLLPASNLSPLNLMSAPHSRLLELSQRKITLSNEQLDLSNIKWILIVVADAKKNNSAT